MKKDEKPAYIGHPNRFHTLIILIKNQLGVDVSPIQYGELKK